MANDARLRAVPDLSDSGAAPKARHTERSGNRTIVALLGVLLAASLLLLLWSRVQLADSTERVSSLEARTHQLAAQVEQRDVEIAAQTARLSEVRTRVQGLLSLIDQPVAAEPAR